MKSKIALWLLIGWLVNQRVRKMRTYRRYSLKSYGYYDLRVEWWYWCERQRGAIYNWIEDRAPNLAFALDKRVPTFYVRRKDAERAARERVRGV